MFVTISKGRKCGLLLCMLLGILLSASLLAGDGDFTHVPDKVIFAEINENVTFKWNYTVQDRISDFSSFSPTWNFYNSSDFEFKIGHESRTKSWAWEVTPNTCPRRLLHPILRVTKIDKATLVIINVTEADAGIYGCTLVLSPPKTSKAKLIVIVPPQIKITGETSVMEYANLTLNCSAVGPPTPNVTWINQTNEVLGRGIQSATLFVVNLTRGHNGKKYVCNATNHPTKPGLFSQKVVTVTVNFKPKLNQSRSTDRVDNACPNAKKVLSCAANGNPSPTYYWYNPSNISVDENKTGEESKIEVYLLKSGNWTCYITNGIGQGIHHRVPVTVLSKDHQDCRGFPDKDLNAGEIAGIVIGVLAGVGIIAVIAVGIYKKKKKSG